MAGMKKGSRLTGSRSRALEVLQDKGVKDLHPRNEDDDLPRSESRPILGYGALCALLATLERDILHAAAN